MSVRLPATAGGMSVAPVNSNNSINISSSNNTSTGSQQQNTTNGSKCITNGPAFSNASVAASGVFGMWNGMPIPSSLSGGNPLPTQNGFPMTGVPVSYMHLPSFPVDNNKSSVELQLSQSSTCSTNTVKSDLKNESFSLDKNMNESCTVSEEDNGAESKAGTKMKSDLPKPPKKPLTPYMGFSKAVWQEVKACNPGLSVTQVGTTIGRLWRELSEEDKQKYNNYFLQDKSRYDAELKAYLAETGLQASDLVKPRNKRKKSDAVPSKGSKKSPSSPSASSVSEPPTPISEGVAAQQSLPHFAQLWTQPDGSIVGPGVGQEGGFSAPGERQLGEKQQPTGQLTELQQQQQLMLYQQLQQVQLQQQLQQQQQLLQHQHLQQQHDQQKQQMSQQQQQGLVVYHIRADGTPECFFQNTAGVFDVPSNATSNGLPSNAGNQSHVERSKTEAVKTEVKSDLTIKAEQSVAQWNEAKVSVEDATVLSSLRAELAEKCNEVNRLMEQLGEAYGLIRQLKQQNDFYHQNWSSLMSQQQLQQPEQQHVQQQ